MSHELVVEAMLLTDVTVWTLVINLALLYWF